MDSAALHTSYENSVEIINCIKALSSYKNIDASVKEVTEAARRFYDADRSYIFMFNWTDYTADNTFESCARGIPPEKSKLQKVPLSGFRYWMDTFSSGKTVYIEDINRLPVSRKGEFEFLQPQGISSLMAVPFNVDGKLVGFWGVDNPRKNKKDLYFIETVSYFVSNEIQKNSLLNKLEKISYCDSLTTLYNRNYYQKLQLEVAVSPIVNCGIVFADINGLKTINDRYGHESGDRELIFVAETLLTYFPKHTVIRMSGDEFLVVCGNILKSDFERAVAELIKAFKIENRDSVSVGNFWTRKLKNLSEGMRKADMLMYIMKQEYYHENFDDYIRKPKYVENMLRDIAKDKYLIYLQPISRPQENSVYYAEALVRYRDEKTIVYPASFIGILEKHYLISDIDFFVFEEICKCLSHWSETNDSIKLAVNISQITLLDKDVISHVENIRSRYGIPASRIILEITETREIIDKDIFSTVVSGLKKLGYTVALDDFGVGYSSISMLTSVDVDIIKLDISITQQVDKNEKSRLIVSTIIDMAHKLNVKCVAEGVETNEQAKCLVSLNCDYLQGYLFRRPLPKDEFAKIFIL